MKTLLLLCSFVLIALNSFAATWVATFEDFGNVEITSGSQGLHFNTKLQVDPKERYLLKLTSACRAGVDYRNYFRQSLEINTVSDKSGMISAHFYIHGLNEKDLSSRKVNTLSLFKLERSHWRIITCVALERTGLSPYETPVGNP